MPLTSPDAFAKVTVRLTPYAGTIDTCSTGTVLRPKDDTFLYVRKLWLMNLFNTLRLISYRETHETPDSLTECGLHHNYY